MRNKLYRGLVEIRRNFYKKRILNYYKNTSDIEIIEIIKNLKATNELNIFNYDWYNKYNDLPVKIEYDEAKKLYYIVENNRRLYLKKNMSKQEMFDYYIGIKAEQDILSPHCYLQNGNVQVSYGDKILDLGGAEGNFVFSNIDKISEAVVVECDKNWIEALEATFEDYPQVKIVNMKIDENTNISNNVISVDDLVDKCKGGSIDFIKMDIEGMETAALKGSNKILSRGVKLAICTYHKKDDYKVINEVLKSYGYITEHSKGYMTVHYSWNFCKPYLRRGLVFGIKDVDM